MSLCKNPSASKMWFPGAGLNAFGSCLFASLGGGNLVEENLAGYEECGLIGVIDEDHSEGRVCPERCVWGARGRD